MCECYHCCGNGTWTYILRGAIRLPLAFPVVSYRVSGFGYDWTTYLEESHIDTIDIWSFLPVNQDVYIVLVHNLGNFLVIERLASQDMTPAGFVSPA